MGNIDILEKLEEYSKAGYVPMHMPGGKRNTEYASTSELDITEIDGFDNMHNADGIIKNASDRAAKLCGADKTLMRCDEKKRKDYRCKKLSCVSVQCIDYGTVRASICYTRG